MNKNEIRINIPEGMEIDRENSTFECIKFKPISKWRDNDFAEFSGYWIAGDDSSIEYDNWIPNIDRNHNVFVTEEQAKSALAMAQISQIMEHDSRFGGVVTNEEWTDSSSKYVIIRRENEISKSIFIYTHTFLAFHTQSQLDLFLAENKDLVKQYLMID